MSNNTNNVYNFDDFKNKSDKLESVHEEQLKQSTQEEVNAKIAKVMPFIAPEYKKQLEKFHADLLAVLSKETEQVVNHPKTKKVVMSEIHNIEQSYIKETRTRTSAFNEVRKAA